MDFDLNKCTPYNVSAKNRDLFYSMKEMKDIIRSHGIPPSNLRKGVLYDMLVRIANKDELLLIKPKPTADMDKFNKTIRQMEMWVKVDRDGESYYFLASSCYSKPKSNKENLVNFYAKKSIKEI